MAKIRVLDEKTINQIAAGEVVESAASVVKELVENSIDAKATHITIEIDGGGRNCIRITDNGIGMTYDDVLLCIERHATSKIRSIDDLSYLGTMGFRGEALSSIASVSHFSILSAFQEDGSSEQIEGTSLSSSGGKITSCLKTKCFKGTTIEVKSLFYNVPARKKFQKSPERDTQEVVRLVTNLALAQPTIGFELISNKKTVFNLKPVTFENYDERIQELLGREFKQNLLPLKYGDENVIISGYIGVGTYTKSNRLQQYVFINGRAIISPLISQAIKEGYGTAIENSRFPVCILHVTLAPDCVDFNVHPQKKEVRFRLEDAVKRACIACTSMALFPSESFFNKENISFEKQSSFSAVSYQEYIPQHIIEPEISPNVYRNTYSQTPLAITQSLQQEVSFTPIQPELTLEQGLRPFAIFREWILVEWPQDPKLISRLGLDSKEMGIVFVNAKRARSRIYYDNLIQKSVSNASQTLLVPIFLELTQSDAQFLQSILQDLNSLGFCLREFGKSSFLIEAYPESLHGISIEEFIHELVRQQERDAYNEPLDAKRRLARIASMSCAQDMPLENLEKAHLLIKELMLCTTPTLCPLGQKVIGVLSINEIQKTFI